MRLRDQVNIYIRQNFRKVFKSHKVNNIFTTISRAKYTLDHIVGFQELFSV